MEIPLGEGPAGPGMAKVGLSQRSKGQGVGLGHQEKGVLVAGHEKTGRCASSPLAGFGALASPPLLVSSFCSILATGPLAV